MDFTVQPLSPAPQAMPPAPINNAPMPASRSRFRLLFITLFFIVIIGAAAFFFMHGGSFSESSVQFEIEAPQNVTSGDLVEYKIKYKNNNAAPLTKAQVTFFYPSGSIPVQDNRITDKKTEVIDLGSIEGNSAQEKILKAYIIGDRGSIKVATATFTYNPQNIPSAFKQETNVSTTINNLAVPLTLVVPPNIVQNQSVAYLLDFRNQSNEDFRNLRFVFDFPDGFKIKTSSPQPSATDTWTIPLLKKGDGNRITIEGTITARAQEAKSVSVVLQKQIETADGLQYVDFERVEAQSVVASPPLSIDVVVNGVNDYNAHLADVLTYTIRYRNNGTTDLNGLTLTAKLDGEMFDLPTVNSSGFFDSRTNTISWNSAAIPNFNILRANQGGETTFTIRLKSSFRAGATSASSLIKAGFKLESSNAPADLGVDRLSATKDIVTRISAAPSFVQTVLLKDSQLGSAGPFPPQVNQQTVFNILWRLTNPANDLSGTQVTATLPPGVSWVAKSRVSGSQVEPTFNSQSNSVTWNVGTLPGGVGLAFPAYEAVFQIAVTPSTNQVGNVLTLLKSVGFQGTDTVTKEKITRDVPDAMSNNLGDSSQSGIVR